MSINKRAVHVHVWKPYDEHDGTDNDLDFDDDVEMTDEYDDHYQYSVLLEDGRTLEIRVMKR